MRRRQISENSGVTVCIDCPMNSTTLQIQSSGIQSCICPAGSFGVIPSEHGCKTCPKYRGIRCNSNSSIPFVEGGFWRDPDQVSLVFECAPKSVCLESGFLGNNLCLEGYRGKRCGDCIENRFRSAEKCMACSKTWISWLLFILMLLLFFIFYGYMLLSSSQNDNFLPVRAILFSIQTFGVLTRFADAGKTSSSLSVLLSMFDLSNVNLEFFFSFECIFSDFNFWDSFTLKSISLLVVLAFMYLTGVLLSCFEIRFQKKKKKILASALDKSIDAFLVFLTTLYTYVLSSIFSAFRCYPQDDGSYTLLSSPSLDCYDSLWFDHLFVIALGILVIVITPVALFIILHTNRNRRFSNQVWWRYGRIMKFYKPKFYFWEVVVLIRKTIFVSLVDLTNGWQKLDRAFVIIVFLVAESFLDITVQPFSENQGLIFEIRTL
jgi:hypothetical protein